VSDDLAIRVEKVGKRYPLARPKRRVRSLRDTLAAALSPSSWGAAREAPGEFWALRDLDLAVRPGEVVGVIGRNGSGKSTLLKILARITEPTTGQVEIWGRVASLLEVGTGFHHELTGRQNIYLSGAILGMRTREIDRRLDEIVAFSEIGEFVDTPVKHYSSGMYMRLGFAVAAHLDADILLVDEVLAVGDAAFQKRCLGRMSDVVREEGRTVLFVSHNLQAVASMCTRAVHLERGVVKTAGAPADVIAAYLGQGDDQGAEAAWPEPGPGPASETVRLRALRSRDAAGALRAVFAPEEPATIEVELRVTRATRVVIALDLMNEEGILIFGTDNAADGWGERPLEAGVYRVACTVPGDLLNEGLHGVSLRVGSGAQRADLYLRDALSIRVRETGAGAAAGSIRRRRHGAVRPRLAWRGEKVAAGAAPPQAEARTSDAAAEGGGGLAAPVPARADAAGPDAAAARGT
jgi:lipopolysaccharide transport system ATP-binding protein